MTDKSKFAIWFGRLFFAAALVFAVGIKVADVALPYQKRLMLPELDDTYAYILTAVQFHDCLLKECPGIKSLLEEAAIVPGGIDQENVARWDIGSRLWLFHSPFWAASMNLLHAIGVSWEAGFHSLEIVSAIVVMTGIAAVCLVFLPLEAAAASLLIMALLRFAGHGLYWFVPGTMAFGVACWYTAYAFRKGGGAPQFLLAAGLLAISMHSIGRVYAAYMAAAFFVAQGTNLFRPKDVLAMARRHAVLLAVLAAASLVGLLFPELRFSPPKVPHLEGMGFWDNLYKSFDAAYEKTNWIISRDRHVAWKASWVFAVACAIGFFCFDRKRLRELSAMLLLVALLLAGGLFYFHPTQPATMYARFLPLFFLFLSLTAGLGFHRIGIWCLAAFGQAIRPPSGSPAFGSWFRLGAACLALYYCQFSVVTFVKIGLRQHENSRNAKIRRHDADLSPVQWQMIAQDCSHVGYSDMISGFVFLSYGGVNCKSSYIDPIFLHEKTAGELELSHAVVLHPAWSNRGRFTATTQTPTRFDFPSNPGNAIAVYFDGSAVGRQVDFKDAQDNTLLQARIAQPGWIEIGGAGLMKTLFVAPGDGGGPLFVGGFRLDPASALQWPWSPDVRVTSLINSRATLAETMRLADTFSLYADYDARVLDDRGSAVILSLRRR
jgi:hypothetical protein